MPPDTVIGVVILAAGASSRMGKPKLLLPWGPTSVLGHLVRQWQDLNANQVAAVCAAGDARVGAELDRLGFPAVNRIVNPSPDRGMFSSIQCAARWEGWNDELTHWAIVLGDQPQLKRETLLAVLDLVKAHPGDIAQPSRRGRPRHPVVLPGAVFGRLRDCLQDSLKAFLEGAPAAIRLCALDDPGLDMDLDTPADYERALRFIECGSGPEGG